jgi:pimeloyl-ACP methyl ester carboxylesterase
MTTIGKAILALVLANGVLGRCAEQMPAATQVSQSVCRGARAKTRVPTLILVGDADIPVVPAHAGTREVGRSA